MKISVNTQSSIRIEAEKNIYFDPLNISGAPKDADAVFITHEHFDHFSPEDILRVAGESTVFVIPAAMAAKFAAAKLPVCGGTALLSPGESAVVYGIPVEAVAAYNIKKPFHPKQKGWLGYIVTLEGKRIYAAGDTDCTPESRAVVCDTALVPVGGTYTMDAAAAAELINAIHPADAIPIHYGSIVGTGKDGRRFAQLVDKDINVSLPLDS